MTNPIRPRMGALLTLVIVVAVWLNAFLTNAKFEDTHAEVEESRHGFVLEAVKGAVQNGLDLGLTLDALPNVQKLMAEEIADAEGVLAMSVVDEKGAELFRAGDASVPADAGAQALPLTDNLGRTVGEARLYFSGEERARFRERINTVTLVVTLIFAGVGALAILILGSRLLGGVQRRLGRSAAGIAGGDTSEGDTAAARVALDDAERELNELRDALGTGATRP